MVFYLVEDIPTQMLKDSLSRLREWRCHPEYDAFGEPIFHQQNLNDLLSIQERNMLQNTSQTPSQNIGDIIAERQRVIYERKITLDFHSRHRNTCCSIA